MNRWSVHVKNFGKIKEAVVEVSPMTLFLGDNNSGKSYLMTLIYGLLNIRFFGSNYDFNENSKTYQECCNILERNLVWDGEEPTGVFWLAKEERVLFINLLNEILDKNKEKFLQELFNKDMEIEELSLSFPEKMHCGFEVHKGYTDGKEHQIIFGYDGGKNHFLGYGMPADPDERKMGVHFLLSYILEYMLNADFADMGRGEAVYFPMARTGFLLTYKSLVGSALQDKFSLQETRKNLLTKPNADFLTALNRLDTQETKGKYEDIITFLERHVIFGHVSRTELPTHDIYYTPEGQEKQLPMFVASGVVTEMTPLLLFLKYANLGTMLMEEPEISLHPELQWSFARVLIRLHNKGVRVFITTHSDIILQHINNMLKLETIESKEALLRKFGYEPEDLLKREDVAVYQFDVGEDNLTRVTRLPCGDYGFEAKTFYDTLKKLNDQIDGIERTESEEI